MVQPIKQIHHNNYTGLSLNDRFTQIKATKISSDLRIRRASRNNNIGGRAKLTQTESIANRRLLQQLSRRHKMQAALKIKRRSMRSFGAGAPVQRGTVKALRVGASGRPIKTNSLSKIATMKADFILNGTRRPLRRTNSIRQRIGNGRAVVGGAAERVARRNIQRVLRGNSRSRTQGARNRSVSRGRQPVVSQGVALNRGRSRSRGRPQVGLDGGLIRGRSRSRGRQTADLTAPTFNRGRSRSRGRQQNVNTNRGRSRSRTRINDATKIPSIKDRLGLRRDVPRRSNSLSIRGVDTGRITKRRNTQQQRQNRNGTGVVQGRPRGRSAQRNANGRSRSRTRRGSNGQQQMQMQQQQMQQQQRSGAFKNNGRRGGWNQQRNTGRRNTIAQQMNNGNQNGGQQFQQRRGRSRSRGGGVIRNNGRKIGNKNEKKLDINKADLDKELDQYMATTKIENGMDFLLN